MGVVHHHHSSSRNNSVLKVALAVATCFSLLFSTVDAFASVKSSTASKRQQQHHHHEFGSLSTSLSAASSMAFPPSSPSVVLPSYTLFGLNIKKQTSPKTTTTTTKSPPLFSIPSIFHQSDSRPIILFDGKCNLCNAGVQLILDNDRASSDPRGNLRVAALQSKVGQLLLSRLSPQDRSRVINSNNNNQEFKTIVVASKDTTTFNSAACIYIGRNLKGPLRYLALLASLIPPFIRDPLYKLLSRHRKKFFGESAECRLWDENYEMRFVDDGVLTGVWRDPFADPNADVVEEEGDGEVVDLTVGPNVKVGDSVKVIATKGGQQQQQQPIVHTHVKGSKDGAGVCSVGLVGKVVRVLEQRAYPKNVVVKFENVDCGEDDNGVSFEAHFLPGQLRKE
ncbi:hypothetical protein ACHAWT_010060 [Skeletonema menzelii]